MILLDGFILLKQFYMLLINLNLCPRNNGEDV